MKRLDLTNQRFGMLTAMRCVGTQKEHALWECKCDCGSTTTVTAGKLSFGHTRSCGCLRAVVCSQTGKSRKKHGLEKHRLYSTWMQMMQRCYSPKNHAYKDYGGRGIRVCAAWHDIHQFVADMGIRPEGMSLDRIDNDGNYEPSNCRWATRSQQNNNTRVNRRLTAFGKTMTLAQWSRETGISRITIHKRIERGWSLEKALTPKSREV